MPKSNFKSTIAHQVSYFRCPCGYVKDAGRPCDVKKVHQRHSKVCDVSAKRPLEKRVTHIDVDHENNNPEFQNKRKQEEFFPCATCEEYGYEPIGARIYWNGWWSDYCEKCNLEREDYNWDADLAEGKIPRPKVTKEQNDRIDELRIKNGGKEGNYIV